MSASGNIDPRRAAVDHHPNAAAMRFTKIVTRKSWRCIAHFDGVSVTTDVGNQVASERASNHQLNRARLSIPTDSRTNELLIRALHAVPSVQRRESSARGD